MSEQTTKPITEKNNLHTLIAGVTVPFLQSIVSFFVVLISAWITLGIGFDVLDAWKYATVIASIALLVIWFSRQSLWVGLVKWAERITHTDLNQDGVIEGDDEQQPTQREHISITLNKQDGQSYQSRNMDLPLSRDQMVALATGLLHGKPFSEKMWAGPGLPFSSNEFRALRSAMLARELIALANPKDARQGFILTEQGRSVMEYFAPPSPSPLGDDEEI